VGVGELKGTNMGISAAIFPNVDIKGLTTDQAKSIYWEKYWNPLYAQIENQLVCNKLFDLGILFGQGTAIKKMQEVLAPQFGIAVDGHFGPKTLEAINKSDPVSLLVAYKTAFVARSIMIGANNPNDRPFIGDWIRRINS